MRIVVAAAILLGLPGCRDRHSAPAAPSLLPHIRTASILLRSPLDDAETTWRTTHNDLLIGRIEPDSMRALNPGALFFEYMNIMHVRLPTFAATYATAHGLDVEDFYLHYREDISHPNYPFTVLVPGYPAGVVPGWNPAWQAGDPPASAQTRSESRALGVNGPTWYLANLGDPGYRAFLKEFTADLLLGTAWGGAPYATGRTDGVLNDEPIYYPQFNGGLVNRSAEYYGQPLDDTNTYALAYESYNAELVAHLAGAAVLPNYGHAWWLSQPDRFSQNVQADSGWALAEVWVTDRGTDGPTSGSARVISYEDDYARGIAGIIHQARAGGPRVLGAIDLTGTDRGRLYTLALYYLVHGANTYYAYQTTEDDMATEPVSEWQWNPAVTVDIGSPAGLGVADFDGAMGTSEHVLFASGADPFNTSLTYRVFARRFTKGMVLAKMLPEGSVVDDRSATTHALGGSYAIVHADGSLGPVVTHVTLRNNEGVVLTSAP